MISSHKVAGMTNLLLVLIVPGAFSAETAVKVMGLDDCIKLGMQNYVPLKLADEEVELARLKRREAQRGLFPALSAKAEQTDGKTEDPTRSPDFTERVYGASLSHTLFEGGKMVATYRQAQASYAAAERSREKTLQDFLYTVTEAYWNLAASQFSFDERERVRISIRDDLKSITEQYVLDLAVKQQFLAVKGQYLQANTQANAARKNFSKAKWEMAKALGLPTPPDFSVGKDIPFAKVEVDLEECRRLASAHRPDLDLQEKLVAISKEGRRVASAPQYPKLTLNSFYGKSASAFESEALHYRDDWQVNVGLNQAFLGNSLGLTGASVHTSPKLGQSSRSQSETKGVNVNFLDGMRQTTEAKQADLGYRQATLKRDELRREVAMDVENAFYGLEQALLQVEFSEEDMKLAEEELKVAESKSKYGLAQALEVAQGRNRLAASRTSHMDALASYQIAVAALNRAVGIPDKFKAQ